MISFEKQFDLYNGEGGGYNVYIYSARGPNYPKAGTGIFRKQNSFISY